MLLCRLLGALSSHYRSICTEDNNFVDGCFTKLGHQVFLMDHLPNEFRRGTYRFAMKEVSITSTMVSIYRLELHEMAGLL